MPESNNESASNIGAALFQSSDSFAVEFMDKVRLIHEHFDKDNDGFLNFEELSSLQLITSGAEMDGSSFGMICQALGCKPSQGLGLDALKLTYAAQGANVDEDYEKVFQASTTGAKKKADGNDEDDGVIEVGDGGVIDISPDA
jgi:hypothetical protein